MRKIFLFICLIGFASCSNNQDYQSLKNDAYAGSISACLSLAEIYKVDDIGADHKEEFNWLKRAAELGDVNSISLVGHCCIGGYGTQPDSSQAFLWFEKAAISGDVESQVTVGCMLRDGISQGAGILKDPHKAIYWFENAAKKENDVAQMCLGGMYRDGNGILKDTKKALFWYTKSANQKNFISLYELAEIYINGKEIKKDLKKAAALLQDSKNADINGFFKNKIEKLWNDNELWKYKL